MMFRRGQLATRIFDPSALSALPSNFSRVTERCLHCASMALINRSRTAECLLF